MEAARAGKDIASVKAIYDQFMKSLPAIEEAEESEHYEEGIEKVTKLFGVTYVESLMRNLTTQQEQSSVENKKLIYYELAKTFSFLEEIKNASLFYDKYIQVAKEQKPLLVDHFISHSMILESGVYTLFGKKPVTTIKIDSNPPSAEEFIKMHNSSPSEDNSTAYRELFTLDSQWSVALKTQWEAFKSVLNGFKLNAHFFLDHHQYKDPDDPSNSILFIHEPSLLKVLNDHYAAFKYGTKKDFDPSEKVKELKEGRPSEFWTTVFNESCPYLLGLIFGFGEANSRCFQQKIQGQLDPNIIKAKSTAQRDMKDSFSIEDLFIPNFISYSTENQQDPVLEAYKEHQKAIIKHLEGKSLREEVFKILKNGSPILRIAT